jgi:environmental stress-induced protein Ves
LAVRILSPEEFVTSAWKNGGGVTHEIARHEDANGSWAWRLSIAEVACDGPFSRFDGMSRILTVIEGAGLELHTPDGVMRARPLLPLHFSGGLAVEGRMVDGPIRDLNVIHDANLIDARVTLIDNPCRLDAGPDLTGFLAISGQITVDGAALPAGAFALGSDGVVEIGAGASGILVTLRELP